MRYHATALVVAGVMSLGVAGCGTSYNVQTMAAPKTTLTEYRTFHLLPTPSRRDGGVPAGAYDPMVNNSITNRALRTTVQNAFENRGYVDVEWMPDFMVAVYASAREKLDLMQWQFGYAYPYSRRGWMIGMPAYPIEYGEGTVIVDVINPETMDLVWRGTATAVLGDDVAANTTELQKAASAIIEKFPRAKQRIVADR